LIPMPRFLAAIRRLLSFHDAIKVAPLASVTPFRKWAFRVVTPCMTGCPALKVPRLASVKSVMFVELKGV
jgi:hypothetical protein